MKPRHLLTRLAPGLLALVAVMATAGPSSAATLSVNLVALRSTATMPDGTSVPMWGYFEDTGQLCTATPVWSVGPKLSVNPGDNLTVNLRNCLSDPVSIVIPGQAMPTGSAPAYHVSGPYAGRVRSFTTEAGSNGTASYSWPVLKPGSYVYHSGTHPQVQVQMGLYGPLTQDAAAGQAYTGVTYTQQRDLFFSEIDPVLHQAVATGKYGETCSNPPCTKTSTLEYQPKYFLINGDPFSVGDACIGGLAVGDSVLLRLYNTGLQELAPMMLGSHFQIVAEGGNKLPYAQTRYSVLLSPGSTKDLVFTPTQNGAYPIIERRLNLTNPTGGIPVNAPGGMQICLAVGTGGGGNTPPGAVNDNYDTNEDIALTVPVTGVLGNDTDADGNPLTVAAASTGTRNTAPTGSGSVTLNADGSFTYTPALNFNGAATFTYQAFDGAANSNTATVTINVAAVNDPPNFTSSPVTTATVGQAYTYDVNAVDPDGTTVTFLLVTSPTGMTINTASGLISWTPVAGQEGPQNVTVRATDNGTPLPAATADQSFTVTVQAAGAAAPLYFSLSDGSAVPGVAGPYDDADIYFWNGTTFSRFFDGSAAGLPAGADIDAFQVMADGSILMSFDANGGVNVPGVGLVQDEDIVRFVPPNTWSLFFDGSLVGLDAGVNNEDIDAFKLLADGRLVISTVGAVSVPGPGGTTVTGVGQDLLVFTPTVAGNYTAGTWAMYFDGSDVGLAAGSENIDGVSIGADGKIYLSTTGAFAVTGVSGTNQDVFVFTPTSLGPTTAGTFSPTLYFDGSAVGLTTGNVDEIQVP